MRRASSLLDPNAWSQVFSPPIAHRGLWSPAGAPENSLAAIGAACDLGYGIELDVQLSADGAVMVFHDEHLARMVGAAAKLVEKTAAELGGLRLKSSRETIPTLDQVLEQVAGRALILIEIKSRPGEEGPLDQKVAEAIEGYAGPVAIIGFNPGSHVWWRTNRPKVLRGFNSTISDGQASAGPSAFEEAIGKALRHLDHAAPHFIAPAVTMLPSQGVAALREEGFPIVAWTVRTGEQWVRLHPLCDNLIFEGFMP